MILLYVSERFFESGSMVKWHFLWRILKLPMSRDAINSVIQIQLVHYIYLQYFTTYICICYQSLPQPTVSPSSSLHGIGCATPRWRWCFCWSGSAVKCRRRGLLVRLFYVGNGWEWMGMDGLLGLLIVSRWIIPENSLRLAQVSPSSHYSGVPQKESRNSTKFKWHKTRKLPQTSGDFELQWSVAGGWIHRIKIILPGQSHRHWKQYPLKMSPALRPEKNKQTKKN